MATRIAVATGNFTAAGTWLTVDATSLSDSEANNTALTTSYVNSVAFTPGAITVDGVAVKLAVRASGTPSNTITIRLGIAGADVAGTVTTMNVADLPQCDNTNKEGGWVYFRFNVAGTPTPVLLLAATAYTVGAKLSATSTAVNLYRTSTSGDWSRMLATTTTGAPASADILHVMGDNLAAGTRNSYTVTMDNTASTTFGVAGNTTGCLTVSKGGTLTWGTSASTAYLLKMAGTVYVYSGGTWNQGTSGTRMPSTSTGGLQFAISSNVDGGLWVKAGATFNAYGASKATNWTYLNTDEAAAQTVLGVVDTTGWAANDKVCIASTTRTYTQAEVRTISTVDSATQITVTAGLTNAHSGTAPTRAEVGNLTRNVSIFGTSTSLQGYVRFDTTAVVNCDSCEFYWLGSATANKRGINIATTTGVCNFTGCTFHDFNVASSTVNVASGSYSGSLTQCVAWAIDSGLSFTGASNTGTLTGSLIIGGSGHTDAAGGGCLLATASAASIFTDNVIANSATAGVTYGQNSVDMTGTFSGNVIHSNAGIGLSLTTTMLNATFSGGSIWRNGGVGLSAIGSPLLGLRLDAISLFGNTTTNFDFLFAYDVTIISCQSNSDTSFTTTNGFRLTGTFSSALNCIIDSCVFGEASGILTQHTADITGSLNAGRITLRNTKLSSTTETTLSYSYENIVMVSQKHDQTDGLNKRWEKYGIVSTDTTTYRTSSPSIAITPNNATNKIRATMPQRHFEVPINNGESVTFTCYVNKSGSYNGNQPRLLLLSNSAIGITADTVLATASGGTGSWLTLSGTTSAANAKGVMEFTVDCDGTAGTVYVSDISVTGATAKDTTSPAYWHDGVPIVMAPYSAGGTPTTIVPSFGGRVARRA